MQNESYRNFLIPKGRHMATHKDLEQRFGNLKIVTNGSDAGFTNLTLYAEFTNFAKTLNEILPDSAAKTIALYKLESASLWAHKAAGQSVTTQTTEE